MMIRGVEDIRSAYRDSGVAKSYVDERFTQPLGALLHERQATFLRSVIASLQPKHVLEIAPGPARLTIELAEVMPAGGFMMDASAQMLEEARKRLGTRTRWRGVQGDVFALPFGGPFDLVYSFRLLRHFERTDRASIYAQIRNVLRPGGLLVFDAVNERVSGPLRARAKPGEYAHYDALFHEPDLVSELEGAGFDRITLEGVQHRYSMLRWLQIVMAPRSRALSRMLMEIVDRRTGGEPLEWIVTCRRA